MLEKTTAFALYFQAGKNYCLCIAMMNFIPKQIFFTKGAGVHKDKLASFELALRKAGIEKCNLVYVSSIFPPKCEIITRERD